MSPEAQPVQREECAKKIKVALKRQRGAKLRVEELGHV